MDSNKKSPLLLILGVLGTLALSWIGSYIYSVTNMENGVSSFLNSVSNYFTNYPYEYSVSNHEMSFFIRYGNFIGAGILGSTCTLLFLYIQNKKQNRLELANIILSIVISISLILTCGPISLRFKAVQQTKNNIEIIRPYVSDHEYKVHCSDFYQIKTKKDYQILDKQINDIAKRNNLSLQ